LEDISKLAGNQIDIISFDIVGSPIALKNVYGLEVEPDYFENAISEFKKHGLKVVPHITVGLDSGNDSGEEEALRMLAKHEINYVVINALMSSEGSEKAALRFVDILKLAHEILPRRTAIGVGCMRPRGSIFNASDVSDIDAIALPSKELIQQLRSMGVDIVEKDGCCAFF